MTKEKHKAMRILLQEHFQKMGNYFFNPYTGKEFTINEGILSILGDEDFLYNLMGKIDVAVEEWEMENREVFELEVFDESVIESDEEI